VQRGMEHGASTRGAWDGRAALGGKRCIARDGVHGRKDGNSRAASARAAAGTSTRVKDILREMRRRKETGLSNRAGLKRREDGRTPAAKHYRLFCFLDLFRKILSNMPLVKDFKKWTIILAS
jgi:hypothetical protein